MGKMIAYIGAIIEKCINEQEDEISGVLANYSGSGSLDEAIEFAKMVGALEALKRLQARIAKLRDEWPREMAEGRLDGDACRQRDTRPNRRGEQ